jgi:hypothetical protein
MTHYVQAGLFVQNLFLLMSFLLIKEKKRNEINVNVSNNLSY